MKKYINTDDLLRLKIENRNLLKERNELLEHLQIAQHTIEVLSKAKPLPTNTK